jgi:hypothetical protein
MNLAERLIRVRRELALVALEARDHRVKRDLANAGTCLNCAIHLQGKIEAGTVELERERPERPVQRGD